MPPETPDTTTRFALVAPPTGGPDASIVIDGQDVTHKVRAFEVAGAVGEVTQVVLWPTVDAGTIEGEGIVAVVDPNLTAADAPEVLAAVADRIRGLDAHRVRDDFMRIQGLKGCPIPDAWLEAVANAIEAEG